MTSLELFQKLCEIGNLLEAWRDRYQPGSDEWTERTDLLGRLDETIDLLVRANEAGEGDTGQHSP